MEGTRLVSTQDMARPLADPALAALRVLVVDDEADIRLGLRRLLSGIGIEAREAASGLLALERLDELPADLIITDLMMPGLTGVELLTAVKQRRPETMVVLLTGFGTVQTAVQCLQAGAAHFLTKPFKISRRCRAGINEEITMFLRDHRAATHEAATTGLINKLPRFGVRWVGKRRAAGRCFNRLGLLPLRPNTFHPGPDARWRAGFPFETAFDKNKISRRSGMAIAELHFGKRKLNNCTALIDRLNALHHILGFSTISTSVHAERPTYRTGNTGQKLETFNTCIPRCIGEPEIGHAAASNNFQIINRNIGKHFAEPDHNTRHTAVPHHQIRADTNRRYGYIVRFVG